MLNHDLCLICLIIYLIMLGEKTNFVFPILVLPLSKKVSMNILTPLKFVVFFSLVDRYFIKLILYW